MKQSMKFKYTEYDETLRIQIMKTHDPNINEISLKAFKSLTTELNTWVLFKDWKDKMKEIGVALYDERGIPIDDFNSYTHRFRAKYEDGISYIGYPELGDDND